MRNTVFTVAAAALATLLGACSDDDSSSDKVGFDCGLECSGTVSCAASGPTSEKGTASVKGDACVLEYADRTYLLKCDKTVALTDKSGATTGSGDWTYLGDPKMFSMTVAGTAYACTIN